MQVSVPVSSCGLPACTVVLLAGYPAVETARWLCHELALE